MQLPDGLQTAINVTPEQTSTLIRPYIEAIGMLLGDGVSEDLIEACMARCLIDHKDPVPFAMHYINLRCQARHEGLRFAEPGWTMPGPRGGRRAADRGGGGRGQLAIDHPAGSHRPRVAPR